MREADFGGSGGVRRIGENRFWIILGLFLVFLLIDFNIIRVILGLIFVLFLPGYTLVAALFPGSDDLTGIEKLVFSLCLSMAVVSLIGFGLNFTPWGICSGSVLTALVIFVVIMYLIGRHRRSRFGEEEKFRIHCPLPKWSALSKPDRVLAVLLVLAVLSAAGMLVYRAVTPEVGERFTEFYVLGPGGLAEGYPLELRAGEVATVIAGVVNHEYTAVDYRVELWAGEHMKYRSEPISLEHGEKWEDSVHFSLQQQHNGLKVEFFLFRNGCEEPYRKLYLWVKMVP